MSDSVLVCGRAGCGAPVHSFGKDGYRHSLGGRTGAVPRHRAHKPVPVLREDWERLVAIDTPIEEAMGIAARFRALDREVNGL